MGVYRDQAKSLTTEDQFREQNPFGMTHGELDSMVPIPLCKCTACRNGLWCP